MKKIVSLLLMLCLLSTAVTAGAAVTPKGEFPVTDEPITLSVAVPVNAKVEDIHTNAYTLFLEENSGINLEIVELSASDAATQVNTIMLSGDLPDAFMGYNFGYDELASYADAGYLLPLDEYIEAYGDEYFAFLDKVRAVIGNATAQVTVDGQIYAVPTASDMVTDMYAGYKIRVPQIFLDNLNLEMPRTLEEFHDYLVAVRDQDANGNGDPSDEIPMTGYDGSRFLIENIGNAFQYTDGATFLKLNDGKVECIATNDAFRETLAYLKTLLDEGLLDPAFYTQDQSMMLTLDTQEYPLVGADASYASANYDSSSALWTSLRIIPNLVGPEGYAATRVMVPGVNRALVITTSCEHPAEAFRLFDFMLSDYASAVGRLGTENVHWKQAAEGLTGRDGGPAKYELIGPQEWTLPTMNSIWRITNIFHGDVMNYVAEDPESSVGKLAADVFRWKLAEGVTGEQLSQLLMDPDTSIEYKEIQNMVVSYINENVAKFVLGDRSMEEWEDYVSTLESIGVDEYVRIAQEAYDAMN